MLKIRLFCAAGMSTSMLMAAIQRESKAQKLEVEVSACQRLEKPDCGYRRGASRSSGQLCLRGCKENL